MNKVVLIGRLTKDPELRYSQGGVASCRFSLAVDRATEGTDYPSCVVFNKQAENLNKYKKKGDQIAVEGKIQTGKYEKNGQTVYTTDIIADRIEYVGMARSQEFQGSGNPPFEEYDGAEQWNG